MKPLHKEFDALMSHLNSDENEMAAELRQKIKLAFLKSVVHDALMAHGVDNWEGYSDAMEGLTDE